MDNSRGYLIRRIVGLLGIASVVALLVAATSLANNETSSWTEGQSQTQEIDSSTSCSGPTQAVIHWGDGTPNSTVTPSNNTVSGTHTYAEEGTYSGSIDLTGGTCGATSPPDHFTATVSDALLNGSSTTITPTASQQFSGPVATFTDDSTTATAGEFSATIDWGDGSTSSPADGQPVTIAGPSSGSFTVNGTHTYATAGPFSVSVQITDDGGQSTTAFSTANVAKAPPMFTQCPPVDANNGCQYLIVVSNSSTTAQFDPNQGPYESSEDSLIG